MAESTAKLRYSPCEFCDATGISRSKFFERVRRGELKVVKDGDQTFVTAAEAARYANASLPFACPGINAAPAVRRSRRSAATA